MVALSNVNGDIIEGYSYGPFGEPAVHTAAGTDGKWLTGDDSVAGSVVSAYDNPFMYTGRRWDSESTIYYYRARMYNPYIGRFMQPDPIGYADSMNLYQYCLNSPVNWVDPFGLKGRWTGPVYTLDPGDFAGSWASEKDSGLGQSSSPPGVWNKVKGIGISTWGGIKYIVPGSEAAGAGEAILHTGNIEYKKQMINKRVRDMNDPYIGDLKPYPNDLIPSD